RTSTNKHHLKVAELENIGVNHLRFMKSLFQHYCQHLELNHNHISAESAFNFYINKKIFSLLGTSVNTKAARKTFYRELIQNTNLPTNHNFVSIITKINKEIEHHTQQRYPITYVSKGKEKLQTLAITPKKIQLPTWKKTRVESPTEFDHCHLNQTLEPLPHGNYLKKKRKKNQKIKNLLTKTQSLKPGIPQQPLQQPQQFIVPIVYAPIAKLEKFTDTVDSWYQSLATKPQTFDTFKQEFLKYFSNNNSINCLVNTFTTIKQGNTEAITTYLGQFHRCLRQIQAINADYFTVAQILNQFIKDLYSSILQRICPLHPADLQTAITNAKNFEAAELEANHAQAINLVINRSSELDSKLKQFSDFINQKLEGYLADN
ncbi:hypothetical protein G9A89_011416, partial [Geosiphon pyriformis]